MKPIFLNRREAWSLLEAASSMPPSEKDVFLAAILSTASESVNTVGKQFAQPIRPRGSDGKPKKDLAKRVARDRSDDVFEVFENWIVRYLATSRSERKHEVWRSDYKEALKRLHKSVNVVYADPPYTRDHYSRYYHVLETLCLRDCPPVSTVLVNGRERISRGIYRLGRHQSPFCIKSQADGAFSSLLAGVRGLGVPLVLSYSPFEAESDARPRLMAVNQIQQLAKKFFSSVEIWTADEFAHSKLNRMERNTAVSYGAENLLLCKP
jgi:adenine-specific DNA methylase